LHKFIIYYNYLVYFQPSGVDHYIVPNVRKMLQTSVQVTSEHIYTIIN